MFIGSCFAKSIGRQFEAGRMPVLINPSGTVYNPVSVCKTLDTITGGRKYDSGTVYINPEHGSALIIILISHQPILRRFLKKSTEDQKKPLNFYPVQNFFLSPLALQGFSGLTDTGKLCRTVIKYLQRIYS